MEIGKIQHGEPTMSSKFFFYRSSMDSLETPIANFQEILSRFGKFYSKFTKNGCKFWQKI